MTSSLLDQSSESRATRRLLAKDHVILNHGQVTWTTPELAPPLLTTTPNQREDISALDRFNVHRCPKRRVFSGTGLELVTMQATVRYLYHSASAAQAYSTRELLATDHVILNHGQVTWTTPELAPLLLSTKPHQRKDVSPLDRFNVHRCPTRRVFSGTGLEPVRLVRLGVNSAKEV
ncbi:uncharacterized protein TNCV_2726201 [Trichonephila clavipes]|nr:uncharacterized protein TNCV_2726201 [Trichonephila clavipes]